MSKSDNIHLPYTFDFLYNSTDERQVKEMRAAIITGVSGGMGQATAIRLIREGYTVFGLDIRQPEPGGNLPSADMNSCNGSSSGQADSIPGLHFIRTDLTDPLSVEQAVREVSSLTDSIDFIVNMAGIYGLDSLVEIPEEEFLKIFQVNLFAAYRVNKAFLPLLQKGGRIIITSSELAPLDPLPFTGIYGITKAALDKYAYSLRMELQLLGYQVIVLRPGAVRTSMLGDSVQALNTFCSKTELYSVSSRRFRQIVDRIEARNISPEKIAGIVLKALSVHRPRLVYKINRNPLLMLMNALPDRMQLLIIKKLL